MTEPSSDLQSPSSMHFTNDNPIELQIDENNQLKKIDSHQSNKSIVITQRTSKPSRYEPLHIALPNIQQRQRIRYETYSSRVQDNHLYYLNISSDGIQCYGINCQPSVYNSSYRCRKLYSEHDLDGIKDLVLMNDQDLKENVSYTSLMDLSNVIDHEPNVSRKNSYLHSKSNNLINKPSMFLADIFKKMTHEQRAKSIADLVQFHENLMKSNSNIHNAQKTTSLPNLNEKLTTLESVTSLIPERSKANVVLIENEKLNKSPSSNDVESSVIDLNATSSPINLISPPQVKSSSSDIPIQDSSMNTYPLMTNPFSTTIQTSSSNPSIESNKTKTVRSIHYLDGDLSRAATPTDLKISSKSSLASNILEKKTLASSSNSILTPESSSKPCLNNEIKSKQSSSLTNNHLSNEEYSLHDVTDPDKSIEKSSNKSNRVKQTFSGLKAIDKPSSHSQSKTSTSSVTQTKPPLIPADDGDTSMITRITTASTNLTAINDDDDDDDDREQSKRNSLGSVRDSLEILRHTVPHHPSNDEQINAHSNHDSTPHQRKSVLKSRLDSSDNLSTPELVSYIAIDEVKGDKQLIEKQMRRRSLVLGGGTIISCTSPKPKRDSLVLLQERYSGSTTPHSGHYHLPNSDSKHVEFIREPGDTITPALHIGRGTKSKHKSISPSSSNDQFSNHLFDLSERSKSETSVIDNQPQASLDSTSRFQTLQNPASNTDQTDDEKISFNRSDYDKMLHLMLTPSRKKERKLTTTTNDSNLNFCLQNRFTTFINLILLILFILFYIFLFIKSQYWQDYHR